jgi:NhaA family Na+:H+ antiporter
MVVSATAHGAPSGSGFQRAWEFAVGNSLLMVSGALIGLLWANTDLASYETIAHSLHFVVNDIAMAFFFGLATKEIVEATAPGGALYSLRRAAVPVIAAVGGMAGPALLYVFMSTAAGRPDMIRGWAIPCATDIAFSYMVARMVFPAVSPAIPFLLLLAIADDALGLILLAVFYPSAPVRPVPFMVLVGAACLFAWFLRRQRTRNFWPYILGAGTVSWVGFHLGGLHPALALVPVLPFVPHAARDAGLFVEPLRPKHDPLSEFEHWWKVPVEFILFAFALTNAGVPVTAAGTTTWIVLASLLFGKPAGIALATWMAELVGFRRSEGLPWSHVMVLGITAGIGFTVALFFTTASFGPGPTLDQAKLGALMSVSAGAVAIAAGRLVGIRRTAGVVSHPAVATDAERR